MRIIFLKITIFILIVSSAIFVFSSCEKFENELKANFLQNNNLSSSTEVHPDRIENQDIFFNLKKKQEDKNPLADLNIRKAIFYSIDRERIVSELFGENNEVLNSIFNKNSFFYKNSWEIYEYNPVKAEEFLRLAGYSMENPLYLTIGANNNSSTRIKIEEIIKENLESIGIKVWIYNKPPDEWFNEYLRNGDYEIGLWSLYTYDPKELINYFNSTKIPALQTPENKNCSNFYWYDSSTIDEILAGIDSEKDLNTNKKIIADFQDRLAEDAVILPLFSRLFAVAYNNQISNVEINPIDGNYLKSISNWQIEDEDKENNEEDELEAISIIAGFATEPNTLNPFLEVNTSMGYIHSMVISGLYELDENALYKNILAESQTVAAGVHKTEYSINIKMKEDIYWEDGSPITSEDVKATIEAVLRDKTIYLNREEYEKITSIEIKSPKELIVNFEDIAKDWQKLFLFIFPADLLKDTAISNLFQYNLFGCGPYKLTQWQKGSYITLEKNENYYGTKPAIDKIQIVFNEEENILVEYLKKGEIDIMSIPIDQYLFEQIKENDNLGLSIQESSLWEQLGLCLKHKD